VRKIDNSKLKDLQQPIDETMCLLVLLRDTDVQFKNVLKSLLFIKKQPTCLTRRLEDGYFYANKKSIK
jgi:hypothetical protein